MIAKGRDKIEWYRQVDPGMLKVLQDMIKAPTFKENMAVIVKTIYEFAFITYAGHKQNISNDQHHILLLIF